MKIAKITMYADNQMAMKDFWIEKFGLELLAENQMGPNMMWIEVGSEKQDVAIVVYDRQLMEQQKPGFNTACPHIMFTCRDAKSEFDRLAANDVEVFDYMEMPYGTMFQFKDIEGNSYVVRQD